jgi:hypothetical protein
MGEERNPQEISGRHSTQENSRGAKSKTERSKRAFTDNRFGPVAGTAII